MLNEAGDKLFVLEFFQVDRSLPKHEDLKLGVRKGSYTSDESEFGEINFADSDMIRIRRAPQPQKWWARWFKKREKPPALSIRDFFVSVKNSEEEIKIVESRAAGYEAALKEAKLTGQQALCEKLEAGLQAFRAESQMLSIGIQKYVTQKTIVDFYKKCPKGLRLSYIRNYTRRIPPELSKLKTRADELKLFDNYVILHYDPQAKSYAETEKEKQERLAKERDPILFGLIKDREDLYVLGDWVDEYCDLTLDQMAEVLGGEVAEDLEQRFSHVD